MDARKKIKTFILEEVYLEVNPSCIEDETPLISSGLVDSLGILKILSFLDDEFGINIASDEIKHENFSTITTITGLVEKKLVE